jgi:hypothetical protein
MFFFIESEKFDPKKSGSSTIDKDRGRGQDLCLRFCEKAWSFTPFDQMTGIRSVSCIRPTCQCRCPPLRIMCDVWSQNLHELIFAKLCYYNSIKGHKVSKSSFFEKEWSARFFNFCLTKKNFFGKNKGFEECRCCHSFACRLFVKIRELNFENTAV